MTTVFHMRNSSQVSFPRFGGNNLISNQPLSDIVTPSIPGTIDMIQGKTPRRITSGNIKPFNLTIKIFRENDFGGVRESPQTFLNFRNLLIISTSAMPWSPSPGLLWWALITSNFGETQIPSMRQELWVWPAVATHFPPTLVIMSWQGPSNMLELPSKATHQSVALSISICSHIAWRLEKSESLAWR